VKRDDRGSIAPLVPIIMFVLLLLGGLVVDGSRQLNGRGDARAYAEEAARAGATAINKASPEQELDTATATERVQAFCRAIQEEKRADVTVTACDLRTPDSFTDAKTCDGSTQTVVVNVKVTVQTKTTLLGMAGFQHFSSTAVASARSYEQTFKNGEGYC
jgi:Flp pilus assembly protein TadG